MKLYIALVASLFLVACSEAPENTSESGDVATIDASDASGAETAQGEQVAVSKEGFPADTFWCEERPEGRHYFYVDPDDDENGMVGLAFSDEYAAANPDETSPGSEMQRAVSGSGILYVNEQTEFRAKGDEGMLMLSDGSTVTCRIEE